MKYVPASKLRVYAYAYAYAYAYGFPVAYVPASKLRVYAYAYAYGPQRLGAYVWGPRISLRQSESVETKLWGPAWLETRHPAYGLASQLGLKPGTQHMAWPPSLA